MKSTIGESQLELFSEQSDERTQQVPSRAVVTMGYLAITDEGQAPAVDDASFDSPYAELGGGAPVEKSRLLQESIAALREAGCHRFADFSEQCELFVALPAENRSQYGLALQLLSQIKSVHNRLRLPAAPKDELRLHKMKEHYDRHIAEAPRYQNDNYNHLEYTLRKCVADHDTLSLSGGVDKKIETYLKHLPTREYTILQTSDGGVVSILKQKPAVADDLLGMRYNRYSSELESVSE